MQFDHVEADSCMHHVALEVAEELREQIMASYLAMYVRNREMGGGMSNVVLAGLTLVWLECVHSLMGTPDSESAISLLQDLRPSESSVTKEMRMAARDFLRRSKWLPKRRVQ